MKARKLLLSLGWLLVVLGLFPGFDFRGTESGGVKVETTTYGLGYFLSPLFTYQRVLTERQTPQGKSADVSVRWELSFISWSLASLLVGGLVLVAVRRWLPCSPVRGGGQSTVALGLLLAGLAPPLSAPAADEPAAERIGDYCFSRNGKSFHPTIYYLHGEPGKPVPGDLIRLGWMYVPLGEEKEIHLQETGEAPARVLWRPDGKWAWLTASTDWDYDRKPRSVLDGLAPLPASELKGLRAVDLHGNARLEHLTVLHETSIVSSILGGEGVLTKESAGGLLKWLRRHGVKGDRD